ncbi:MAG: aminoglycoside phosphotransferase family protein [Actinomycetota bacterium]
MSRCVILKVFRDARPQLSFEAAMIDRLASEGFPCPRVLTAATSNGHPFVVSTQCEGRPLRQILLDQKTSLPTRMECLSALARTLKQLHEPAMVTRLIQDEKLADHLPRYTLKKRANEYSDLLQVTGSQDLRPAVDRAMATLLEDKQSQSICHGDATLANAIADRAANVSLVDWSSDFFTLGPRELDLAVVLDSIAALRVPNHYEKQLMQVFLDEYHSGTAMRHGMMRAASILCAVQVLSWIRGRAAGITSLPGCDFPPGQSPWDRPNIEAEYLTTLARLEEEAS